MAKSKGGKRNPPKLKFSPPPSPGAAENRRKQEALSAKRRAKRQAAEAVKALRPPTPSKPRVGSSDKRNFRRVADKLGGWTMAPMSGLSEHWSQGYRFTATSKVLYPDFQTLYDAVRKDESLRKYFDRRRTLIIVSYDDPKSTRKREHQSWTLGMAEGWRVAMDQGAAKLYDIAQRYADSRVRAIEILVK